MCLRVVEKDIVRENAEAFSLPEMQAFLAVGAATGTNGMRKLVASFKYTTCRRATRAQRIEVHARLFERLLLGRRDLFALLQDEVAANGAKSREQRLVMCAAGRVCSVGRVGGEGEWGERDFPKGRGGGAALCAESNCPSSQGRESRPKRLRSGVVRHLHPSPL